MEIIYQPLGSLLGGIYGFVNSYWLSIVIFTVVVKVVLLPLTLKQIHSTQEMTKIQPELQKLQNKYKNDKETLNIKIMELYKEHNVNPMAGCLPLLIQMPILFGLFGVLRNPLKYVFNGNEILTNQALVQGFLWIKDLSHPDSLGLLFTTGTAFIDTFPGLLPIIAAFTTYISMKLSSGTNAQANQQMKMMQYMMPLMILWFGKSMSAGLMIYWIVSNLFQIGQQMVITKIMDKEVS